MFSLTHPHSDIAQNGRTPYHISAKKGHKECLELLIQAGCDVNQPDKARGEGGRIVMVTFHRGQDEVRDNCWEWVGRVGSLVAECHSATVAAGAATVDGMAVVRSCVGSGL